MTRNLKALGLALVAVFAMSAVAASGAQAESFHSHAEHTTLTAKGTSDQTFTITNSLSFTCKKMSARGDITGTASGGGLFTNANATVRPFYEECKASNGDVVNVTTTGCHYRLNAETDANGHGKAFIECGTGAIKINDPSNGCTVSIPTGEPTEKGVHYTNEANGGGTNEETIAGEATVTGIHFTSNFICQLGGVPKEGNETHYVGSFTVEGFKYESGNTEEGYVHGPQVGIFKE